MALQPKRRSLIWLHFLPKFSFTTPPLPRTVFENDQNRLPIQIHTQGKRAIGEFRIIGTLLSWTPSSKFFDGNILKPILSPAICLLFLQFSFRVFLNFHWEEFSLLQCWVILLSTYVFCCLGPLCFEVSVVWGGVAPSSLEKFKQEFMISLVCNL